MMQHCAEERRKLAAEWAQFHAKEKQRHERAEREASSLLEKREDSIISLAQVRFKYTIKNGTILLYNTTIFIHFRSVLTSSFVLER